MTVDQQQRIKEIVQKIPSLTAGQIYWLERVLQVFESPHNFQILNADLLDLKTVENFGDALRIRHSFAAEPFTKDKFEFVLQKVLTMSGHDASLAPKGNRGYDISINGTKVSLKTQADRNIREDKIWISKFMELGKGQWRDNPKDLVQLRSLFLQHLRNYERIFTLRALRRAPHWDYELVEIPKRLMLAAKNRTLQMQLKSKQYPKPGYCYVRSHTGEDIYQLYFDAGSERKLQVKNLLKTSCLVHATWNFVIPPE